MRPQVSDVQLYRLLKAAAVVRDPSVMDLVMRNQLRSVILRSPEYNSFPMFIGVVHKSAVFDHIEQVTMLLDWIVRHFEEETAFIADLTAAMAQPEGDRCLAVAAVTLAELIHCVPESIYDHLINAVQSGYIAMVELHLNAGANVRHNGNSALRLAEQQGHAAIAELLKTRGAGFD